LQLDFDELLSDDVNVQFDLTAFLKTY